MIVKLINSSPSLSVDELNKVENSLGISFPDNLKSMWLANNGGELDDGRRVYQNENYELDIEYFLPVLHTKREDIITVEWLYKVLVNDKKILSQALIPFAINGGGFPYCVNAVDGAVFYANLERQKEIFLAPDLDSFIANVITEDEV